MFLENKSILFFSAQAFGYQNEIRAEMERMGARVDYFDERPANSFAIKAAIRINRNLLARYIDRYHARIIERTKNRKYDYVFFIKGESISVENLEKIKELHPEAKLIIYHWDSIANNRNALRILPVFDRAFSFDKPDCEKLGIRFLPLFYLRDYEEIGRQEPDYRYDLLFVGTVHSDRYGLLRVGFSGALTAEELALTGCSSNVQAVSAREAEELLNGMEDTVPPAHKAAARAAVWDAFFRQELELLPAALPDALRAHSSSLLTDLTAQDLLILDDTLEFLADRSAAIHTEALPGGWDGEHYTLTDDSHAALQTLFNVSPTEAQLSSASEP